MSADNWAICPKCQKKERDIKSKQKLTAVELYGKIPIDEWREFDEKANSPIEIHTILREDFEIGIDGDGVFYINYKASCERCGFKHRFKYTENIKY